ncbi:protein-L-isoaspartate(D-aspartate) O-methyltransferase [Inhella inkyongensis]|uniref:Protein-L-isoaspartate O-methyltransferase n=1 Tax=Inhella inkyongensis TaxID=392593 RepID=A0A840S6P4_9BURK|nr:protein-L-isoaspartate O-methyltransferase [Inhella inkyongensis]MBB5204140.1 protein-L-isoaspartate(D-aspartate) O-methyltransferase [Inhella inkyongensis]
MSSRGGPPVLRPQRLLQQAAQDRARLAAPSGIGLDSPGVRLRMVERLRRQGVQAEGVLQAFAQVPRHRFVDTAFAPQAYEDTSLPIGHGQTISKPSVVARMLDLLHQSEAAAALGGLGRVLEVGTGCGYQAMLLGLLAKQLVSIERLGPLHQAATHRHTALRRELPLCPMQLIHGDGRLGWKPSAPFDHIIAAAGGESLPQPWLDQLAPGGRLVAPTLARDGVTQILVVVDHCVVSGRSEWRRSEHEGVLFVPLKSGLIP